LSDGALRATDAGARCVDELAGGLVAVGLADAMVLEAATAPVANAAAEPSASMIFGTAIVCDMEFLLRSICC
jgi:hypothetical protein